MQIVTEIEKIKAEVKQSKKINDEINELSKLLQSGILTKKQIDIINIEIKTLNQQHKIKPEYGIKRLCKYRLTNEKVEHITEAIFLFDKFLERAKNYMVFGESGVGKSLIVVALSNMCLLNHTAKSVIILDFDMGLLSLKKRNYNFLAQKWGEGKFDYIIGEDMIHDMEPMDALNQLIFDESANNDKIIILDSGSHFVYDGSKNERQKINEMMKTIKILRKQGALVIIIHHSHRVRDGSVADYHGPFEWKRDLDYQILITKNEGANTWLLEVKKDRDRLIENKAFQYNEIDVTLKEVDYEEFNISADELHFIKEIQQLIKDFDEVINQSELLRESKSFRQRIGLTDKRAIKWLITLADQDRWIRTQKPEQKNAIFYTSFKTAKDAKLPN